MQIANEYKRIENPYDAFLFYAGLQDSHKYPQIYLSSSTFNPGAGDGWARTWDGTNFDTARNAANAFGVTYNTSNDTVTEIFYDTEPQKYIYRAYFPFVTSSLGSKATVVQAGTSFKLYVTLVSIRLGDGIGLIQTTQASTTSLAVADWSHLTLNSPTQGATQITLATMSSNLNTYSTWSANSSLVSWINVTGNTLLGLRSNMDITDSGFPSTQGTSADSFNANYSENGTNMPQLVVTYTLPIHYLSLMGVGT